MEDRYFLNVEKSVLLQQWHERLDSAGLNRAQAMVEQYEYSEIIARILAARDVAIDEAEDFLNPTLRDLMPDPSILTDMDKAAKRLAQAVENKEKIAIFGDYDVDGATSCALIYRVLSALGLAVEIYIPDRQLEGYGPNEKAIEQLIKNGAELLLLVDCGSTSYKQLAPAQKANVDVVIFDHHQTNDELPVVYALVNPNRQDDLSQLGHLCAVGVCYLGLVALLRCLRENKWFEKSKIKEPNLLNYLDLVALGTICDMVPLKTVNRAFVVGGLFCLRKQMNVGIKALCEISKLSGPVAVWHLGFILGPRINAGGRIGDASLGAKLLTIDDEKQTLEIAQKLDGLNRKRQEMEKEMLASAFATAEIEMNSPKPPNVLILTGESEWHVGIVGLLASRLKDRFNCPSFAIAFDVNGVGSGSGRSVAGIDLGSIIRRAVDKGLLERGGGHAMAAGITLRKENLGKFRVFIEEEISMQKTQSENVPFIKIDAAVNASAINLDFWQKLESAGPYGNSHPQPIFAFAHHRLRYAKRVGENHVSFTIAANNGVCLQGIGFRIADEKLGQALLQNKGKMGHFVGTLSGNYFRNKRQFQLQILDLVFV